MSSWKNYRKIGDFFSRIRFFFVQPITNEKQLICSSFWADDSRSSKILSILSLFGAWIFHWAKRMENVWVRKVFFFLHLLSSSFSQNGLASLFIRNKSLSLQKEKLKCIYMHDGSYQCTASASRTLSVISLFSLEKHLIQPFRHGLHYK